MCTAVRTHWLRPRKPPPHRIWAHIRGRYWSAKIDDISLCPPAIGASLASVPLVLAHQTRKKSPIIYKLNSLRIAKLQRGNWSTSIWAHEYWVSILNFTLYCFISVSQYFFSSLHPLHLHIHLPHYHRLPHHFSISISSPSISLSPLHLNLHLYLYLLSIYISTYISISSPSKSTSISLSPLDLYLHLYLYFLSI